MRRADQYVMAWQMFRRGEYDRWRHVRGGGYLVFFV